MPSRIPALLPVLALFLLPLPRTGQDPSPRNTGSQGTRVPGKTLRLALSGWMDGQLEPCGCASAQSGGLDRRAWWLKAHRNEFDLALEGGRLIHRNDPLEKLRFETALTILGAYLRYPVLPLGPTDLALGMDLLRDFHEAFGPPFLVTDLRRIEGDRLLVLFDLPYRIVEAAGIRLCLLSLAGPEGRPKGKGWKVLPPEEAVAGALAEAGPRGDRYDLTLLFVNYGGATEARRIARTVPGLDLVLSIDGSQEPREEAETFLHRDSRPSRTRLLYPGWHGKALLLCTLELEAGGVKALRLSKQDLPAHRPEGPGKAPKGADPAVFQVLLDHKKRITEEKILEALAGRDPAPGGATYLGNEACRSCHPRAFETWKSTLHAKAWESLVHRGKEEGWRATRHPACVTCHSTGYGKVSGFTSAERSPKLAAVGCESCHGPGSKHVETWKSLPRDTGPEQRAEFRRRAHTPLPSKTACYACHTFAQSPGFDFKERWGKIRHGRD